MAENGMDGHVLQGARQCHCSRRELKLLKGGRLVSNGQPQTHARGCRSGLAEKKWGSQDIKLDNNTAFCSSPIISLPTSTHTLATDSN